MIYCGFEKQIRGLLVKTPVNKQVILFATLMSQEVLNKANEFVQNPVNI
jgi:superfamily II DNA/RNA helicase